MATPAAALGDRITGTCPEHLYPGPLGPVPAGPQPFNAPVTVGTVATVLLDGRPAVVASSSGLNATPHGVVDRPPASQIGRVLTGSPTVLVGGLPLAHAGSSVTCCTVPGVLVASVVTVLVA